MKETATLSGISLNRVGERTFERLCKVFPQGHKRGPLDEYWDIFDVLPDDPRLAEAIDILKMGGFGVRTGLVGRCGPEPKAGFSRSPRSFRLSIERTYSRADLDECELLELMGRRFYRMLPEDDPLNTLWVTPEVVRSKADFVQNDSSSARNIIVPVRVRTLLVAGRFRHIDFRPVLVSKKLVGELTEEVRAILEARGHQAVQEERQVVPWEKLGEPWSELWSDLILPPLSPLCVLMDHTGNPYREGVSVGGQFLHEGFYLWPEMRYRRSDLAKVDHFDIALTHEQFGFGPPADYKRAKVVSQRFYRYCIDNGLKANWRPVRIEED